MNKNILDYLGIQFIQIFRDLPHKFVGDDDIIDLIDFYLDSGININSVMGGRNCLEFLYLYSPERLDLLKHLLNKGIDYIDLYNKRVIVFNNDQEIFLQCLQKYHDSKLLKEKLDTELKLTEVITKRSKI